jgi:predicted  nucleic acid-binding Zn-ribbon protein
MVRLQEIYNRIAEAIRERGSPPPEVVELQEENQRRQEELEALEGELLQHHEELREVRRRENEYQLELEHFQKQRSMVTNEREFVAVLSEIDYATKGRDEAAARRKELESLIEERTEEVASRKQSRPEEEAAHQEVVDRWEARKTELRELVHQAAVEARDLEKDLLPAHRARFLRLLESKRGVAVAAAIDGSCSLCHFSLRPHLQQRVRRCEEIISCEHCHRILYLPDAVSGDPGDE